MAAKFTAGDSNRAPPGVRNTQNSGRNHAAEPRSKSFALQRGNTMSGMPGYVNTKAKADRGDEAQGGPGVGPHREGYIGRRGASKFKYGEGGTMTTSTAKLRGARAIAENQRNDRTGRPGPRTRSGRSMPPQEMTPQAEGRSRGFNPHAGKDAAPLDRGWSIHRGMRGSNGGHRGRMERLAGTAKTSYEGRAKKSVMY